jgi:subtilisin family serine protease
MNMKYLVTVLIVPFLVIGCECQRQEAPRMPVPVRHGPHMPIRPPPSLPQRPTAESESEPSLVKRVLTVAVIDTGLGFNGAGSDIKLCQYGHKDFTGMETTDIFHTQDMVPVDHMGHGTHVAGVINQYAGKSNFCIIIIKFYDPAKERQSWGDALHAIQYATKIHADVINFSAGGTEFVQEEQNAVKKFLDQGGTFIAAAGNENHDLAKQAYYPAMSDPRVIVVGNLDTDGKTRAYTSNYGKRVTRWEIGTNVKMYDMTLTGTSQATSVATGKIVSGK